MSEDRRQAYLESLRRDIADEDAHYSRIKRVFETPEGVAVAEWVLSELCGYWLPSLGSDNLGRYSVGRAFFHALSVADIGICHRILDSRRALADRQRAEDKAKLSQAELKLKRS